MRILILGATGRTGKYLIPEAVSKGYNVNCLVRKVPDCKFSDATGVKFFLGSPGESGDLENAMGDCDAIVSTLNISRTSDFPWAKLRTPEFFLSETMKLLIFLAEKNKIKRIVVCSAWGAAETKDDMPRWFRWLVDNSNIGFAYRDHERQEGLLHQSKLDWTIVRPTGLINSSSPQKIVESYNNVPKPGFTISRHSLAKYLIDAVENTDLIHKSPVISGIRI